VNGGDGQRLKFSVVIPAWNDAENLARLLPELRKSALRTDSSGGETDNETIVVDAANDHETEEIALANGATYQRASKPNRGEQMNMGASAATGDVLVFHHADSWLTPAHFTSIKRALQDRQIIGGAFHRKFDERHPRLKFLEPVTRIAARLGGTMYGDQSMFVRREIFERLGGFATIPLMEDLEFSQRLRAAGRLAIIDPPIETSARRHLARGAWRASLQNGLFIVLYKLGVSPQRLHRWYYRETA
jgi:rSAM/selenodomain-associated transferase 2